MNNVLVYYAAVEKGGLARYAVCQILALHKQGVALHCLGYECIKDEIQKKAPSIQITILKVPSIKRANSKVKRALDRISLYRAHIQELEKVVRENSYKRILISSYVEYFSPLWSRALRKLARNGVQIGVVVHDPVRDFILGPKWWHFWSVSMAYSFVDTAFVHEAASLDTGWPKRVITTVVIPHGPYVYPCPTPTTTRKQLLKEYNIPEQATVLLCFGHIRDGKNLHLAIEVLTEFPDCHLIIAGSEQSFSQRPAKWYRQLASEKGVTEQCHWFTHFIPEEDVHRYFIVSDVILLLYSEEFHSASGVLNVAVQFRKPCLASSGDGPLKSVVEKYALGVFIEPGSLQHLSTAISAFRYDNISPECKWDQYLAENSWEENAKIVINTLVN